MRAPRSLVAVRRFARELFSKIVRSFKIWCPNSAGDWLIVCGDVAETVEDVEWRYRCCAIGSTRSSGFPEITELWTIRGKRSSCGGAAIYLHL